MAQEDPQFLFHELHSNKKASCGRVCVPVLCSTLLGVKTSEPEQLRLDVHIERNVGSLDSRQHACYYYIDRQYSAVRPSTYSICIIVVVANFSLNEPKHILPLNSCSNHMSTIPGSQACDFCIVDTYLPKYILCVISD